MKAVYYFQVSYLMIIFNDVIEEWILGKCLSDLLIWFKNLNKF